MPKHAKNTPPFCQWLYNAVGDNPEQKLYSCVKDSQRTRQPVIPSHLGRDDLIGPTAYARAEPRDERKMEQYVLERLPLLDIYGIKGVVETELNAMSLRPVWCSLWEHPCIDAYQDILVDESHQQAGGFMMNSCKWTFQILGSKLFGHKGKLLIAEVDLRVQNLTPWQMGRVRWRSLT